MDRRPQPIPANARPRLGHRQPGSIIAAVALSMSMSLGLLGATVGLFQQDGAPLGHVVVAERACSAYRWFVSEREACIAMYLAASRQTIASREPWQPRDDGPLLGSATIDEPRKRVGRREN